MKEKSKVMKKKKKEKAASAVAFHGETNDGTNVVGIGNLRVVILEDDGTWFAQGLEIDYAAQGDSLEGVKKNFEEGLCATIHLHLKTYSTIERLLKSAPSSVWKEMLYSELSGLQRYSQVSFHRNVTECMPKLPFEGIEYIQREAVAA
jgi:hypothetical protein